MAIGTLALIDGRYQQKMCPWGKKIFRVVSRLGSYKLGFPPQSLAYQLAILLLIRPGSLSIARDFHSVFRCAHFECFSNEHKGHCIFCEMVLGFGDSSLSDWDGEGFSLA